MALGWEASHGLNIETAHLEKQHKISGQRQQIKHMHCVPLPPRPQPKVSVRRSNTFSWF